MKKLCVILIAIFSSHLCLGQIYDKAVLYPDITKIITKYANSESITKKIEEIDSLGRIVSERNFNKDSLLSQMNYVYDNHNNRIAEYRCFDMTIPDVVNANIYDYTYDKENIITSQKLKSTIVTHEEYSLIKKEGDSLFIYQRIANCDSSLLIIKYNKNGYVQEFKRTDMVNNSSSTYQFQYDSRGSIINVSEDHKWKDSIQRIPRKINDKSYCYTYYNDGLLKEWFHIIKNIYPYYRVDTTLISEVQYIKTRKS